MREGKTGHAAAQVKLSCVTGWGRQVAVMMQKLQTGYTVVLGVEWPRLHVGNCSWVALAKAKCPS